jgi:hypothetical protein
VTEAKWIASAATVVSYLAWWAEVPFISSFNMVGLQAAQTIVDGVHDVLAGETLLIRIISHGIENLGSDHQFVPRRTVLFERAPGDLFADPERINICRVKKLIPASMARR